MAKKIKQKVKVSIILCTHNREQLMLQAIESIMQQSFQDFELIVIDGNSNDSTPDLLQNLAEKYDKLKWTRIDSPTYLNALNYAMTLTSGEYITFLESDDLYIPNKLQAQFDFLEANPKVDVVSCSTMFNKQYGIGNTLNMLDHKQITELLKTSEMYEIMHFPSIMVRKSTIDNVFGNLKKHVVFYPEFFEGRFGDAFLYVLLINKCKFANINNTLYLYRLGADNNSLSSLYEPNYYIEHIKSKSLITRKKHIKQLYNKYIN